MLALLESWVDIKRKHTQPCRDIGWTFTPFLQWIKEGEKPLNSMVTESPILPASYQPCSIGTAEAAAGTRTPAITCAGHMCITAAHSCLFSPPDELVCCRVRKCLP